MVRGWDFIYACTSLAVVQFGTETIKKFGPPDMRASVLLPVATASYGPPFLNREDFSWGAMLVEDAAEAGSLTPLTEKAFGLLQVG